MCVISLATKTKPTEEMVEKMFNANDHGAGLAWREGDGKNRVVKWEKGLKLDEIQSLIKKVPLPFVAHFRIASCGGQIPALTHPFPISKDVQLNLSGSTKGYVLFHNGHWGVWKSEALKAALNANVKVPSDKWSDSRTMAWLAHIYGLGVLEFIDEKCIAFGPDDLEIVGKLGPQDWGQVDDVWVSNKHWEFQRARRGYVNLGEQDWTEEGRAGNFSVCANHTCYKTRVHNSMFCWEHKAAEDGNKPSWQCHQQGCIKGSLGQTSFCVDHQARPIDNNNKHEKCLEKGCKSDVASNSRCWCPNHLPKSTSDKLREFSGGAPVDPTFRSGDKTVRDETDESKEVRAGEEGLRAEDEGSEEGPLAQRDMEKERGDDALRALVYGGPPHQPTEEDDEQWRWAASFNAPRHAKVEPIQKDEVVVEDKPAPSMAKGIQRMICALPLFIMLYSRLVS